MILSLGHQSLELLIKKKKKKKKEKISGVGRGGCVWWQAPSRKILKVETNLICAIRGIMEANLKKSSKLKFMMNISFVPSIHIHHLNFPRKNMLVDFPPMENICSAMFDFHFRENPRFRDEFQALVKRLTC